MIEQDLQKLLEKKEMEVKALLEITQAINNNVSEDSLYKIFKFTALSNLRITRLCLFVFDGSWAEKVRFGTSGTFIGVLPDEKFSSVKKNTPIRSLVNDGPFAEFDLVVPVPHKGRNLALVFIGGLGALDGAHDRDELVGFLQALSNIMIVAIENKKLARRELEQEALRRELEIAGDVQQLLFPERLPKSDGLRLEASYLPHDMVGGDYYDYIPLGDDMFMVCIADVSGKGVGAALMMSSFQASLKTLVRRTASLEEVIRALNTHVLESARGEKFITVFAAVFDRVNGTLSYVNAGHNPPLLFPNGESCQLLADGCTVLGAIDPLPVLKETVITGLDRFLLFCYTDGLSETVSETGLEYGIHPVIDYLEANKGRDLSLIHQDIIIGLDHFKGRNSYRDDITMLSCAVGT
ncbi:MAG: PP2C family protein-serine/threonine phosphatase [Bacteroidota bacterium]